MAKPDLRYACLLMMLLAVSCSPVSYSAYPLDLTHDLPSDAFARCRMVLLNHYETLAFSDAESFRLETDWMPSANPPGERRATVYRDETRASSLAIVVELRRLTVPLIGLPHWTSARGDAHSERQLAEWLRESLAEPEEVGISDRSGAQEAGLSGGK